MPPQHALPIKPDYIFFTCTHTHEGPEVRERKFRDRWYDEDSQEAPFNEKAYRAWLTEEQATTASGN